MQSTYILNYEHPVYIVSEQVLEQVVLYIKPAYPSNHYIYLSFVCIIMKKIRYTSYTQG